MNWRRGFTLVEAVVSIGVGMLVLSIATASFAISRKALATIDALGARTAALQSAALWTLNRPLRPDAYPSGPQLRQIGTATWTYTSPAPPVGQEEYHLVTLRSFAVPAQDIDTFYLPVIRN